MPLIFVHGVSNRMEDPSYQQGVQLRRRMVAKIIGSEFADFPAMADARHVYWGDLGVKFLWEMASLPTDITLEAVADEAAELGEGVGLAAFLSEYSDDKETSPLLNAARNNPAELIDVIALMIVEGCKEVDSIKDERIDPYYSEFRELNGTELADLLIATGEAKNDHSFLNQLAKAKSDFEVNNLITKLIAGLDEDSDDEVNEEGITDTFANAWSWVQGKVSDTNEWVKNKLNDAKSAGARSASVMLLKKTREQFSKKSFLFFGDIFEYIKRGQGPSGSIKRRVRDEIVKIAKENTNPGEPLVVISHSFGGEIVYDLLTSDQLGESHIDLWVTVGSQVGLFAEMSIYDSSSRQKPTSGKLGKPEKIGRWINVYDPVDVFSFLCEPVFGEDAVTDIKIGTGHVASAHGAYFTNPKFYGIISKELQVIKAKQTH